MSVLAEDLLRFGVCWYPEHWSRSQWVEDVDGMHEMGLSVVRIGESAWSFLEPSPGEFDFDWLDHAIELCAERDMGVILGTPTYAPPAWLETKHPEIIARNEHDQPHYRHSRRMYDYTQPAYVAACQRIVQAMVDRYGTDKRVWAWQLDNEMWCHLDRLWGSSVRQAFQEWLQSHYENIDELNKAWGMAFWSNTLQSFEQADLPGPNPTGQNSHQYADYLRFLSDLAINFLGDQAACIRAANPQALVVHNCPFGPIDRAALLENMDAYGHDHYPAFEESNDKRRHFGLNYGRFRAYSKRLWVLEQQASQVGNVLLRKPLSGPGELANAALQSIGHGADLICWFRWRSFPAAQEMNWGGLLPPWNTRGRHFEEARQLVSKLMPYSQDIGKTKALPTVARLLGYEQQLAQSVEPWLAEYVGDNEIGRGALCTLSLNEDHIRPQDLGRPGQRYSVALLPHAVGLNTDDCYQLEQWVASGGVLIVGPLAGHRDTQGHLPTHEEPPGPLAPLTGTRNGEATTWAHGELDVHGLKGGGQIHSGSYGEIIEPVAAETEVIAVYASEWLAGKPAITERAYGKGRVIHCGVRLCDAVLEWLWVERTLPKSDVGLVTHDNTAEVRTRVCDEYALHFAINHGGTPAVIHLYRPVCDLLTGAAIENSFSLPPYGWRILREHLE